MNLSDAKIAIIGLGYVGLPLAVEFGKKYQTVGFDINQTRINELISGIDSTLEVDFLEVAESRLLSFSADVDKLKQSNIYIVTVPTPIDAQNQPDLTPLIEASKMLGSVISNGDVVIYESTVYPGATEEICLPVLENSSNLKFNKDFYAGYSPERINPGDKKHRVTNIKKVTSGSTVDIAELVDQLYCSIITAGTHKASSIKVAEASKVIENAQRDLNIALVNELSIIFHKLNIDTIEVLEAAGTKWNFLPFRPGLVGGHCIGVDPYYLTHKAQSVGYFPDVILSGRRINNGMGAFIVSLLVKAMLKSRIHIEGAKVLVMGLSFKENCPDIRNTRVIDIINELNSYNINVEVSDPWVENKIADNEFDIKLIDDPSSGVYDAVIIAVGHQQFEELGASHIRKLCNEKGILFDIKGIFHKDQSDIRL